VKGTSGGQALERCKKVQEWSKKFACGHEKVNTEKQKKKLINHQVPGEFCHLRIRPPKKEDNEFSGERGGGT